MHPVVTDGVEAPVLSANASSLAKRSNGPSTLMATPETTPPFSPQISTCRACRAMVAGDQPKAGGRKVGTVTMVTTSTTGGTTCHSST